MKKKILATVLAMVMTASVVACGNSSSDEPISGEGRSFTLSEETAEESTEVSAEATTEVTEEVSAEAASSDSTEVDSEEEFTAGVVDGQSYVSELFNLKFTVDDDMTFAGEDQLAELNSTVAETVFEDNEQIQKAVDDGTVMIVAYAVDDTMIKSFNVAIQSVGALGAWMNEEAVLTASETSAAEVLESQGFENVTTTIEDIKFMGEDHPSLLIEAEISGVKFYQRVCCLESDGYVGTFTLAGLELDVLDNMFANSEKLN